MSRNEMMSALAGMERGPAKRYPIGLRDAVVRFASAERDRGRGWSAAAEALGVPLTTLLRRCMRARAVPVTVQHERSVPLGWRIEGLSLDQAARIARRPLMLMGSTRAVRDFGRCTTGYSPGRRSPI